MPALAREQSQINYPPGPPPSQPLSMPGAANAGFMPQFSPDFWKGQLNSRVPVGTVLSGILNDNLSSQKSKQGDIFEIELQDGWALNGKELIPKHSKIVGTVVNASPAKLLRHGAPGRLQVSLQSLVLPDGRNLPFSGFIDHNPNLDPKNEPITRNHGASLKDYGQSLSSFLGSFTSGIGVVLNRRNRGLDFELKKGEVLPVRLNRNLDLGSLTGQGAAAFGQAMPGQGYPNGAAGAQAAARKILVPGLAGPDPDASIDTPAAQAAPPAEDPNRIFKEQIRPRPLADMADPF